VVVVEPLVLQDPLVVVEPVDIAHLLLEKTLEDCQALSLN
jgi:hypothetical protein